MATDYDAVRKTEDDLNEDSLEALKAKRAQKDNVLYDVDAEDARAAHELPGADLSNEELTVQVVPKQADEFTCSNCFLVRHRSQLSDVLRDPPVCAECATRLNRKSSQVDKKARPAPKADKAPARR